MIKPKKMLGPVDISHIVAPQAQCHEFSLVIRYDQRPSVKISGVVTKIRLKTNEILIQQVTNALFYEAGKNIKVLMQEIIYQQNIKQRFCCIQSYLPYTECFPRVSWGREKGDFRRDSSPF